MKNTGQGTEASRIWVIAVCGFAGGALATLKRSTVLLPEVRFVILAAPEHVGSVHMAKGEPLPLSWLRPIADLSWIENEVHSNDRVLLLAHLRSPDAQMYLPGILARLAVRGAEIIGGAIYPWEMVAGDFRPSCDTGVVAAFDALKVAARKVVVTQEDYARDEIAFWDSLSVGGGCSRIPMTDEMNLNFGRWNREAIERMSETGRKSLHVIGQASA